MILNKIILENIRSYQHQEVPIPTGTILLCGDVGAGKSTILLAVDFALFGLQKGNLSGETLLRKGSKHGSVELHFDIEGAPIILKRNLKQGSGITQESAELSINGQNQHLTPVETKQRILQLLNYPQELLTKSKSLIYRYTVYTPQEEMKHILYGEPDIRLDTLRKIFGIDRYKRIKENTKVYLSYLKTQKKQYEGMLQDYALKQHQSKTFQEQLHELQQKLVLLTPLQEQLLSQEQLLKQKITTFQEQLSHYHATQQHYKHTEQQLQEKIHLTKNITSQLDLLLPHLQEIPPPPTPFSPEELTNTLQTQQELITQQRSHEQELATINYQLSTSQKLIAGIQSLEECPTCKQSVTLGHKEAIALQHQTHIQDLQQHQEKLMSLLQTLSSQHQELTTKIELLKQTKSNQELLLLKHQTYQERILRKQTLEEQLHTFKKEIGGLNSTLLELQKTLQENNHLQEELQKLQQELIIIERERTTTQLEVTRLGTTRENLERQQALLLQELQQKEKAQQKLSTSNELHDWLQNSFIPSLETMEHHVLLKIHADFNAFYTKWFTLLMGSEELLTRLDDTFTPLVEQNGHVIEYTNLSGGEQTAVALAYRLALNHVINNLMVDVKTRDLLILDEPTDGFSHEQIDRIQLILEELNIKQVIIVSHEPKIEGFVDHIIRVEKQGHVSHVI